MRQCSVARDVEAWEEFVRRFHRLIAKVVLRAAARFGDPSKETVDDLIQDTYLKFYADNCRILREFEHRHPNAFLGYVQAVAVNVVRDHFKSCLSKKRGEGLVEAVSEGFIPPAAEESVGSPKSIERAVLIEEVRHHLELCVTEEDHERSKRIFWLYYRVGLSASAISAIPSIGLSTKGVESVIFRITRELRRRMDGSTGRKAEIGHGSREGVLPAESF